MYHQWIIGESEASYLPEPRIVNRALDILSCEAGAHAWRVQIELAPFSPTAKIVAYSSGWFSNSAALCCRDRTILPSLREASLIALKLVCF